MNTSSSTSRSGHVLRGLPYVIQNRDPITIGSHPGSDIVIKGADEHHARLCWHEEENAWYIEDDPAPGETIVNGEPIVPRRLREKDWFDIVGVRIRFEENRLSESRSGHVLRGLPYVIQNRDPITIGSHPGSDIVIKGADEHHARLCWHEKEETWYIEDDPAPGETIVNGEPIVSRRLYENDWFDIVGVSIRFAEGRLSELDPDKPVGLRVTLRGVFSATVFDNISFQVEEGSFVALLGPSGGGKSTLLQCIAGLAPYEGEIRFNGHELRDEKDKLLPLIAYLPQEVEGTFYQEMSVREAMEDFTHCHLSAAAGQKKEKRFAEKLEEVGLSWEKDANKPVRLLSGGMKRRFALALALLRDPQMLLLDEPAAGLDPASEAEIMELLKRIAVQGSTVLCATHVLGSLERCDKVLLLASREGEGGRSVGRSVFFGKPAEALEKFDVQDWLSVYQKLKNMEISTHDSPSVPEDPVPRNIPSGNSFASFGRAFRAIFSRLFWQTVKCNWALFFVSPLAVAAVLVCACRPMFGEGGSIGTVCFCMVVAMFWLGLSGSVRSFVVERIPKRCLDKMRGLPLVCYFSAHVAYTALSVLIQSLLFVGVVFLVYHHPKLFAPSAFPVFWIVLALVGFAGASVGLMVSSLAKKEVQAVWLLPFIAILALFLSKPVLETEGKAPEQPLRAFECAMPTLYPQTFLETKLLQKRVGNADNKAHLRNLRNFALLAVGYPFIFLPLAYLFQKRREAEWDGR